MSPELSSFGRKLGARTGILELMDDLGNALSGGEDMLMLGGGNPAHIPAVQAVWRRRMEEILADGNLYERVIGNYDPPQGNPRFIAALTHCLNREYGWELTPENVAVTNGGQTAFFFLLNMLAGAFEDGTHLLGLGVPDQDGDHAERVEDHLDTRYAPSIVSIVSVERVPR